MKIIKNYLITKWLPQSEQAWLEAEKDRINKNPVRQAIIAENGKRRLALIENKPVRFADGGYIEFS
jgi:hypothetical protein